MREPLSDHPEIMDQWDHTKNTSDPHILSAGSGIKAWWICKQGHSYKTAVSHRTNGSQCPYCTGILAITGVNDIATIYKEIVQKYWDYQNNTVDPGTVSHGSTKKFQWKCDQGHTWSSSAKSTAKRQHPCIECEGKHITYTYRGEERSTYIKPGVQTIAEKTPEILQWWSEELNPDNDPYTTGFGSRKVVWWECDKGHSWERSVKAFQRNKSCPYCKGTLLWSGFNDIETTHPHVLKWYDTDKNNGIPPSKVKYNSTEKVWWKCDRGHSWLAPVERITNGKGGCATCSQVYSESHAEKEIKDFILSILPPGHTLNTGDRNIIRPREIDIYLPDYHVAIEFNGVYWHSDKFVDNNYHYDKRKSCHDKGIQLITIWEDEWRESRDIIKKMITHKLRLSPDRRIYARQTHLVKVLSREASRFLNTYHIQGNGLSGSFNIGLEDEDKNIVAVSVWKKNKNTLYLDRYATSCMVIGGMGKLLKQGIKYAKENGCTEIVTFADHQVSDGGLYEKLGFRLDKELKPDYKYVVNGHREHKFGYRLKRFRDDPSLKYFDGMTEKELALLNNIPRVYDCGKSRYVYDIGK